MKVNKVEQAPEGRCPRHYRRGKGSACIKEDKVEQATRGMIPETVQQESRKIVYKSRQSRAGTSGGKCLRQYRREKGMACIKVDKVEQAPEGGCKNVEQTQEEGCPKQY